MCQVNLCANSMQNATFCHVYIFTSMGSYMIFHVKYCMASCVEMRIKMKLQMSDNLCLGNKSLKFMFIRIVDFICSIKLHLLLLGRVAIHNKFIQWAEL